MSGLEDADAIQQIFEEQQSVTTWHEMAVQSVIEKFRALRESDEDVLRSMAGWDQDRDYIPDNLAEKICITFADMMFGEDPIFKSSESVAKEIRSAQAREAAAASRAAGSATPGIGASGSGGTPPPPNGAAPGHPPTHQQEGQPGEGAPTQLEQFSSEVAPTVWPTEESQGDVPPPEDEPTGSDQVLLNNIIDANELPAELHAAEQVCSSEGEVWWRIYTDHGQSDYPIIEWQSRSHVRPLYRGRHLRSVAFVSEVHRESYGDQWTLYRYLEIHADGIVRNLLYRGTPTELGIQIPLTERPETEFLEPEWEHDLGILAGRVYNKLGRDRRVGVSDFHNILGMLLSLNEATTIGHENMRLTAKKRIAVPREALGEEGTFDASEDVLVMDEPLDDKLGASTGGGKFAVLEYQFDAVSLIEWKLDLIATILSRVGIVAEFASAGGGSRSSGGGGAAALSGTALRMRLIPTTLAAKGKSRPWDAILPKILLLAQQLDALPEERGGFGRDWHQPDEPPSVERGEPLPTDESEETQRHVAAVGGSIESRRTAVADLHPTWDQDQVQQELDEIAQEIKIFGPPLGKVQSGSIGGSSPGQQLGAGIVDSAGS